MGVICNAKAKTTGHPCTKTAQPGKTKCYYHGGRSLAGIVAPAFKDGRYSKHLPQRLLARYAEAAQDSELLELREEVRLIDARLADVLTRVDTGESGKLWAQAQKSYLDLRAAMAKSDSGLQYLALNQMDEVLGEGVADWAAWTEVKSLVATRKSLVESERKRLVEAQQMMTAEQAMVFVAALTDTVRKHVTDRDALAAISADLARLLSVNTGAGDLVEVA